MVGYLYCDYALHFLVLWNHRPHLDIFHHYSIQRHIHPPEKVAISIRSKIRLHSIPKKGQKINPLYLLIAFHSLFPFYTSLTRNLYVGRIGARCKVLHFLINHQPKKSFRANANNRRLNFNKISTLRRNPFPCYCHFEQTREISFYE